MLRLGFVASLLSKPVLVGYITGVGLVLFSSQLQAVTGVPISAGDFFPRIVPDGGGHPGLPALVLPDVGLADLAALLPVALGIVLVGYTDNVLTGRAIATRMGYRIDADQEFAGLGVANLAAGLTQGMPVSSSASAIVDVEGFRDLWRLGRVEFALVAVTALGVMVFDVLIGVLLAVGLSVTVAIACMARPEDAVLGGRADLDGWVAVDQHPEARTLPGLLVYRFDAPLFFVNADRFRSRLVTVLEENPGAEEWVILDFEGIGDIDATAVESLRDLLDDLAAEQVGAFEQRAGTGPPSS